MSKSAYTDEEIKNVFHDLFTEKKKLKELEQQLDQLRQRKSNESEGFATSQASDALLEENSKLKQQLASLKARYDELANTPPPAVPSANPQLEQELNRLKSAIRELEESKSLLDDENKAFLLQLGNLKGLLSKAQEEAKRAAGSKESLENDLEGLKALFLKAQEDTRRAVAGKREAESALETYKQAMATRAPNDQAAAHGSRDAEALKEQNQILHKALTEAEEQNHRQKIRLEKLAEAIQEKEKRIHELHQYEYTHKKTSEQRQDLQSALEKAQKESTTLQAELSESRQHAEQLERVIKFLRERSEEGQLASKQFKDDFENSQETIRRLEHELHDAHEQLNNIKHSTLHAEQEKEELKQELQTLQEQFERLKNASKDSHSGSIKLEAALAEAEKILQREQENSLKLAEQLSQQNALVENSKKEIEIIKQALIRGMREANELEARFKESVQEKVGALNKFNHARQLLEKQEQETRRLRDELKQASTQLHAQESAGKEAAEQIRKQWQEEMERAAAREESLKAQLDADLKHAQEQLQALRDEHKAETDSLLEQIRQLKTGLEEAGAIEEEKQALLLQYEQLKADLVGAGQKLEDTLNVRQQLEQELQNLSTRCQEKERDKNEVQEQAERLSQEKTQLQNVVASTRAELEEKGSQIAMAQQHLAKKVKEAAHLSEEVDKCRQQIHDLQQQHMQNQIRMAELQASVDIHTQQEKRLQDQLAEVIKTYDAQTKKWEHKYFEMQDRWQATEMRKKELEKLEERHMQMQALLANLGSVMSGSPSSAAPPAPLPAQPYIPRYEEAPKPVAAAPEMGAPIREAARHVPEEEYTSEQQPQKPYQNLFNMPKAPDKHRQNLFD